MTAIRTFVSAASLALAMAAAPMASAQPSGAGQPDDFDQPVIKGGVRKLGVGDLPPKIVVDKWVQGEPVKKFERGTVYLVEFWATWCGPCKDEIPHLNALEAQHPGLRIVAIASREKGQGGGIDNNPQVRSVEQFVRQQGSNMSYTVGVETRREMYDAWMKPAGRTGIPSAFLIGADGRLAWIGHPANVDGALTRVMRDAKKFDDKKPGSRGGDQGGARDGEPGSTKAKGKTLGARPPGSKSPGMPTGVVVGATAPKLEVARWIKGVPVRSFDNRRAHVLVFWATWSEPSREAFANLSKLQKAHERDTIVMAVAASERPATDERGGDARLRNVDRFVREQGDAMDFRVGFDPDGEVWKTWVEPTGKSELPLAFIIDRAGRIAWIGPPSGVTEEILAAAREGEDAEADRTEAPRTSPLAPAPERNPPR